MEVMKYLELNDKESTIYQIYASQWQERIIEKFIVLNSCIKYWK